jgi:large subunit ribosomal protein L16
MPLMPKRVKFRKNQRGVARGKQSRKKYNGAIKGNALRGNYVAYGDYGLQALEGGWLSAEAIESGRVTVTRFVSGEGRYYIRVFPHKSVTSIPAETRMGKGKGEPEYWAAVVRTGQVLFEVGGLPEQAARDCLARVAYKMPFKCRFVARRPNI